MIYLQHFKTLIDYNIYKNSYEFVLPNVSSCEEDLDFIVYNPEDEESGSGSGSGSGSEGGPSEPILEENQVLCKYNVTSTANPTTLLYNRSDTSIFSSMEIDGIKMPINTSYTFDTTGEHTVLFILAENVTSIGESTFYECSGLTSITIPDSVTSIGDDAFQYCSGLISVTIGNSVTSIGDRAFGCCSELTSISVAANNQKYDSRNNCNAIIETSTNTLIAGCKNTIIPNSVISIGNYAFRVCSNLTSITIPDSVTSIGYQAFFNCSGLTSVTIGNSVTSIGSNAFASCSGLTSITIPDSVTSIGDYAFNICEGLTSVYISNSVTSIGNYAFHYCSRLTHITCNTMTAPTIQSNTFYGVKINGTLTVPAGSTGYDVWMGTGDDYLGKYNWNKIEVLEENQVLCKYNVTSTTSTTTLLGNNSSFASMSIDGIEMPVSTSYTFDTTGEHTVLFTLAEGITLIYHQAFQNCSGLTSVTIGNSVTSIGNYAFSGCSSLTSITIPDSVTSINQNAFRNCSSLTSITIPDSVTSIGNNAFQDCTGFTSITIGNSVTSIGNYAFSGCSSLTSITIPNSVTSIGEYAFQYCSKLISITCNATSAPTIQSNTFKNVKIGGTLIVPAGSTGYDVWMGTGDYYLGKYGWNKVEVLLCKYDVTSTTSVTKILNNSLSFASISIDGVEQSEVVLSYTFDTTGEHTVLFTLAEGVTSIGDEAFYDCSKLTSITIPDSVTSIGESAFQNCSELTSVTIGNSVTSIGNWALSCCSGLTSVTIPDSVASIGESAFQYCSELISITIPDSVTSIGYGAFEACSGLTSITIGNAVTSIGDAAFRGCTELTSVTIGNSVTSISRYAFCDCYKLTNIIIPDSVTSIGSYAFYDCSKLTSITIPNSVTSIGYGAFEACSGLTSIIVDSNNQTYDSRNNCNAIIETSTNTLIAGCKNTIIPDSVTSIGEKAFSDCSGLTSITIPNSVTSIGNYAFFGCSGLTNITCNASTAPTIFDRTFQYIKTSGTLTVPAGSTGYDVWLGTGDYYLGKYGWNKVEQ